MASSISAAQGLETKFEQASRLFSEVKKWELGDATLETSSSKETYYVQICFGKSWDKVSVTIRVSAHRFNPKRQKEPNIFYYNLETYNSESDCLAAAKSKAEEIIATGPAAPIYHIRRDPPITPKVGPSHGWRRQKSK